LNESHWRHRQALPGAAIYAPLPAELSIFAAGRIPPVRAQQPRQPIDRILPRRVSSAARRFGLNP
jgi:hypothetical protein